MSLVVTKVILEKLVDVNSMKRIPVYESFLSQRVNECIVLATTVDDDLILAKNRDRTYIPEITINRDVINDDLEVVYIKDEITGWAEGMNSKGIGIINSALMVGYDEKEKEIVKGTGKKTKDGECIRRALEYTNIDDVIKSLLEYRGGVIGHTIVSDGKDVYTIEFVDQHNVVTKKRNPNKPIIRTNHGHEYTTAGYTEGPDYLSSVLRKAQVLDNIEDVEDEKNIDIIEILSKSKYDKNDFNNVVRDTEGMLTTSQMYMNLNTLEFNFKPLKDKVVFKGIENDSGMPEGYEKKITINILD